MPKQILYIDEVRASSMYKIIRNYLAFYNYKYIFLINISKKIEAMWDIKISPYIKNENN
jgi:hypothetical protein